MGRNPDARAIGGYLPALDGLRAFAVVAVLIFHQGWTWLPGGYLGVSLFFTLSGYLITALLLGEAGTTGGIHLERFWNRRFRRLLPASLAGIALALVYVAAVGESPEGFGSQVLGALAYVVNWVFIAGERSYADLFETPSPLEHYWSLAIEEQFYLVMPLLVSALVAALRRYRRRDALIAAAITLAATASLVLGALLRSGASFDRLYLGTDVRSAEILIGASAAALVNWHRTVRKAQTWSRTARLVTAVAGALAGVAIGATWAKIDLLDEQLFTWVLPVHAIAAALLVVSLALRAPALSTVLSAAPLVALGRVSYGVYVYHWPIFLYLDENRVGTDGVLLFAIRCAVTAAVAVLSFRYIEAPIREGWTSRFAVLGPRRKRSLLPIGLVLVALLGVVGLAVGNRYNAAPTAFADDSSLELPVWAPDGTLNIIVIHNERNGDLVADFAELTEGDPRVQVDAVEPLTCGKSPDQGCRGLRETWSRLVETHDPDAVLLAALGPPADAISDTQFSDVAIGQAVDALTDGGAEIVWATSQAADDEEALAFLHPATQALASHAANSDTVTEARLPFETDDSAPSENARILLDTVHLHHRGEPEALGRVAVIGDSQASSLAYGLERWALAHNLAWVDNAAVGGCGVLGDGETVSAFTSELTNECEGVDERYIDRVERLKPEVVIIWSSVWDVRPRRIEQWDEPRELGDKDFDQYLRQSYARFADELTAAGAQVVWLAPPCTGPNPVLGVPFESISALRSIVHEIASTRSGVDVFPIDEHLCTEGDSVDRAPGSPELRPDGVHLTPESSLWFSEQYGEVLLGG